MTTDLALRTGSGSGNGTATRTATPAVPARRKTRLTLTALAALPVGLTGSALTDAGHTAGGAVLVAVFAVTFGAVMYAWPTGNTV